MTDLREIDLSKLNNVDPRLIEAVKAYFEKIMEKQGNPLDYRVEEIAKALLSGTLEFLVVSTDPENTEYYSGFAQGEYKTVGQLERGDINKIRILDECLDKISLAIRVVGHELEHFINTIREKEKKDEISEINDEGDEMNKYHDEMDLWYNQVVNEAIAEIGTLYTVCDDKKQLVVDMLAGEIESYPSEIRFIVAMHEATGNDIEELIKARRELNKGYIDAFLPPEALHVINELREAIEEREAGYKSITASNYDIDLLYEYIQQLKKYMQEHPEIYKGLIDPDKRDLLFTNMDCILDGKQDSMHEYNKTKREINGYMSPEGSRRFLYKSCLRAVKDSYTKFIVYQEILKKRPHDKRMNLITENYRGYVELEQLVKDSLEVVGDNSCIMNNVLFDYLSKYSYTNGELARMNRSDKVEVIYRDGQTGKVRKVEDGIDVTDEDTTRISNIYDYEQGANLIEKANISVGQVISEKKWKKIYKDVTRVQTRYLSWLPFKTKEEPRLFTRSGMSNMMSGFSNALDDFMQGYKKHQKRFPFRSQYNDHLERLEICLECLRRDDDFISDLVESGATIIIGEELKTSTGEVRSLIDNPLEKSGQEGDRIENS
ncbi:MAG: hypothetical protein FWC68_02010 [Oscillospiraceae bacterium]|nr:hypothetical protein [Oscillospiraceae bacterium]